MRCRRMEAPAVAEDVSATEWRRHPAKPATELIVSTNPSLRPDKPYPPTATQVLLCAVGVVPTRQSRSRGVSPRYAGRQGRLRACTVKPDAVHLKRLRFLVTTSIIKSDVFRPYGPGGGAFQWWVVGLKPQICSFWF